MNYKIVWTKEALSTFEDRITYLKINWTNREINNFKSRSKEYLETLKKSPYIGKKSNEINNVFIGLLLKQVSIIYRVYSKEMKIELLSFIDNRQDPDNVKYR